MVTAISKFEIFDTDAREFHFGEEKEEAIGMFTIVFRIAKGGVEVF